MVVIAQEYSGSSRRSALQQGPDGKCSVVADPQRNGSVAHALKEAFLPMGYPESVNTDYLSESTGLGVGSGPKK